MMMLDVSSIPWTQGRSQPRRSGGASAFCQVGTGVGANKCLPFRRGGPRVATPGIFCIFLIQNPAFWCILWLWKWALPVFLSRPLLLLWLLLLNTARRNNVTDPDPSFQLLLWDALSLSSLSLYRKVPLKLSLSDFYDYTEPVNVKTLGPNFLYFGFIPASKARNRNKQGIQVRSQLEILLQLHAVIAALSGLICKNLSKI